MFKFAARRGDLHLCPDKLPSTPPIPHIGGPILTTGKRTVNIGGMPVAFKGDKCICIGPPDEIVEGSKTVKIMGKSPARFGDKTKHDGKIILACFTVTIGG